MLKLNRILSKMVTTHPIRFQELFKHKVGGKCPYCKSYATKGVMIISA